MRLESARARAGAARIVMYIRVAPDWNPFRLDHLCAHLYTYMKRGTTTRQDREPRGKLRRATASPLTHLLRAAKYIYAYMRESVHWRASSFNRVYI